MENVEANASTAPPRPSSATLALIVVLAVLGCAALAALGTWQLERRSWKLELIRRVDSRVHAPPTAAPSRQDWPKVDPANDEYLRVRLTGTFLHDRETLVRASTELGAGYWVMTPLRTPDGALVLVNRGFVPTDRRDPAARQAGAVSEQTSIVGLLRMTEPGGSWPRVNDPASGLWYSRDIAAIAAARSLDEVAPYFVDADAGSSVKDGPVGGLTVLRFSNNHLVYALTWYALALMLAGGTALLVRDHWRWRRRKAASGNGSSKALDARAS